MGQSKQETVSTGKSKHNKKTLKSFIDSVPLTKSNEEYESGSTVREHTRCSPVKKRGDTHMSEYEDDPGRSASQDFLAAIKNASARKMHANKKATRHMKDFEAKVTNAREDLNRKIDTSQQNITDGERRALQNFHTMFSNVFDLPVNREAVERQGIDMQHETFSFELQAKSEIALQTAYKLISEYQRFEVDLTQRQTTLLAQRSPCNFEDIRTMLDAGYAVGQNRIDYLVNNRKQREIQDGKDDFYTALDPSKSTWNKTSREQLKVMRKVAKIIHEEAQA